MCMRLILWILCLLWISATYAQVDSTLSRVQFDLDFRFRAEQDWDSRRPDGTLRDNRSRLRYRLRTGVSYTLDNYSVGLRVRTGNPNKQQDPQLTLGKGLREFGTLPLGFEKIYFQYKQENFRFWLGKNTYPFRKNNELFWSDNVFPEGVMLQQRLPLKADFFDYIKLTAGHYILASNDGLFRDDAYMQGLQISISALESRLLFFPSLYRLRNIPDIPDGSHTSLIDYTIIHLGTTCHLLPSNRLTIALDYYHNVEDYSQDTGIESHLADQKSGVTLGVKYGELEIKNDWYLQLTYAYLERYAILDYMAQNDWARWDYSASGSPDGRLSNMQGIEVVAAYAISDKVNLVTKYYLVNQLVAFGRYKETGQRIRFDLNVRL